jgi:hypothetical protein
MWLDKTHSSALAECVFTGDIYGDVVVGPFTKHRGVLRCPPGRPAARNPIAKVSIGSRTPQDSEPTELWSDGPHLSGMLGVGEL